MGKRVTSAETAARFLASYRKTHAPVASTQPALMAPPIKKPARPQSRHARLIAKLVEDGAETPGFSRRIVAAVAGRCKGDHEPLPATDDDEQGDIEGFDCLNCILKDELRDLRIIPDAFSINRRKKEVIAYEVEDSNPVSDAKLVDYQTWWWALDEHYWMLRLVIVNRFGHTSEIDLFATSLPGNADAERVALIRDVMDIRRPGDEPIEMDAEPA